MHFSCKHITSFVIAVLLSTFAFAASFTVNVSKNKIDLSEYVQITYTIQGGNDKSFSPGMFTGFDVASGPNSSSQVSIINGKMTSTKTYSYYLKAKKEGKFMIKGGFVYINGKKYNAKLITIEVTKSKTTEQADSLSKTKQGSFDDFVFIDIEFDKDTIYKGEQVITRYTLYTAYQVSNLHISDQPSFPGMWVRDLNENHFPQSSKVISGRKYNTIELKRLAMFPQVSGDIVLDDLEMTGNIKVRQSNQAKDPFEALFDDPFFSSPFSRYRTIKKTVRSDKKTLVVLPLPKTDNEMAFTGGVGKFTAGATMNNRNLKTDEIAQLSITINGNGNIKLLDEPIVQLPDGLEVYDTKIEENIYTNSGEVRGSKKFEIPIIPRKPGTYTIPALQWSYFDIELNDYQNYTLGPYTLNVQPGDDYSDNESTFDPKAFEIKDIKPQAKQLAKAWRPFINSPVAWALAILPLALLPLVSFVKKRQEENKPSELELKRSGANKVAIAKLTQAKQYMQSNDDKAFYDEVIRSIWDYLQDKFGMEKSELDKAIIKNTLTKNNINSDTINGVHDVISKCEIALFAPSAIGLNKQDIYNKSVELISTIEDQLT